MSDEDWIHVERLFSIIKMAHEHGTRYGHISNAAYEELTAMQNAMQGPTKEKEEEEA